MIYEVIFAVILVIWIIAYILNKKAKLALPYMLMAIITPFYNILDSKFLVDVFGCGCVPIAQTNMFNIDFNANDLRRIVYFVFAIIMLILGIKFSKNFNSKIAKIIYNVTILIFNLVLAVFICKRYMWN